MKTSFYLILLSSIFLNCNSGKDDKLSKLFYGLPIYENSKAIELKLMASDRFVKVHSRPLPKEAFVGIHDFVNANLIGVYNYAGQIRTPILAKGISVPDSSKIEFTYTISVNKDDNTDTITVKIFQMEYFFSNSADIDALYNEYLSDLKTYSSKVEDLTIENDNVETAKGTKIIYVKERRKSQSIEILKKSFPNGSKSLRLQLLMS